MKHTDFQVEQQVSQVETPATDTADSRIARRILLAVLGIALLWGGSVALWGIPGLYIPALAAVPVLMATLVIIARG